MARGIEQFWQENPPGYTFSRDIEASRGIQERRGHPRTRAEEMAHRMIDAAKSVFGRPMRHGGNTIYVDGQPPLDPSFADGKMNAATILFGVSILTMSSFIHRAQETEGDVYFDMGEFVSLYNHAIEGTTLLPLRHVADDKELIMEKQKERVLDLAQSEPSLADFFWHPIPQDENKNWVPDEDVPYFPPATPRVLWRFLLETGAAAIIQQRLGEEYGERYYEALPLKATIYDLGEIPEEQ